MRPTVAFAPLDDLLSVSDGHERACLLIGIHALLNDRNDCILTYSICTDVDAIKVAAASGKEETVVVTEPYA